MLDVIAVGAHPDDCEIGCGGTLAKLANAGYRVGIIDLTDGEPTPLCDDPKIRLAEAAAAAECLGVVIRKTLDLPNRSLFDELESRLALAAEFRRYRPKLVIGMLGKTPLASPDHWQAMQIIDAAIFYSRLSKWDHHFAGLAPHPIQRQLYYALSFDPGFKEHGMYPVACDISDTLTKKLDSIRCYQTQFPPAKQSIFPRVEALARIHGYSAGLEAAEVLYSPRLIGVSDVLKTVCAAE
jgi:N-acetylglucosamine malate deacetylase 1